MIMLRMYVYRPSKRHMSVQRYVSPAEFDQWRDEALALGFKVSNNYELLLLSLYLQFMFVCLFSMWPRVLWFEVRTGLASCF